MTLMGTAYGKVLALAEYHLLHNLYGAMSNINMEYYIAVEGERGYLHFAGWGVVRTEPQKPNPFCMIAGEDPRMVRIGTDPPFDR